ncbi:MAG: HisA/HisF-related TIM barrel protein, partial [Acidimicrobiales bacterium]
GWTEPSGRALDDILDTFADARVDAVVVTAIARDGTLTGPDLELFASVLEAVPGIDLIASGGVGTLADLEALASLSAEGRHLSGAIVGKALHDGAFTVGEAVAACRASG